MEGVAKTGKLVGLDGEKDIMDVGLVAQIHAVWSFIKAFQIADDEDKAAKQVLGITRQLKAADYNLIQMQYVRSRVNEEEKTGRQRAPGCHDY